VKACPHCSAPISILRIARCQNDLKCSCCGQKLRPDRRSQAFLFATLIAFFPLALFLTRHINGQSFLFGLLLGMGFGIAAGCIGCLIYACTVRLHEDHRQEEPRNWGGLV